MKKMLFIMVAVAVSFSMTMAQKRINPTFVDAKVGPQIDLTKSDQVPLSKKGRFSTSVKMYSLRKKAEISLPESTLQSNLRAATATTAHSLEGTYNAAGTSYFDNKPLTWTVTVTQDSNNATKFWFSNLIGDDYTTEQVYATLNGTDLVFPTDQLITREEDGTEGILVKFDGSSFFGGTEIKTRYLAGSGRIQFTDGFGSYIVSEKTFYKLIKPNALFTNRAGGTGEEDPAPPSYYLPTQGLLYVGMDKDGSFLVNQSKELITYAVAPPYSTWSFKNYTENSAGVTSSWLYSNDKTANTRDLTYAVTVGEWNMPVLKSSVSTANFTEYILGASKQCVNSYISAGGGSIKIESGELFNVTNANLDYGVAAWQWAENDYIFGTGRELSTELGKLDKLVAFYDAPSSGKLYFEGVDVMSDTHTGPANTELTLEVVRAQRGTTKLLEVGEVIAVAKLRLGDVSSLVALSFRDFVIFDEDGFETKVDYLEIDHSFAFILSGFNKAGVNFNVISERENRPDGLNYSFFVAENAPGNYYQYENIHNTMFFELLGGYYDVEGTAISTIMPKSASKVFRQGDDFVLSYPSAATSVSVYNITGQRVAEYKLNATGTYTLPAANLANGVYVLKFNGANSTVKILK
jgi:hypothetical protein